MKNIPSIGQLVHFHPTAKERLAAIVTETFPLEPDALRPKVNLQVFMQGGKIESRQSIQPYDLSPDADIPTKNFWAFPDEFEVQTPPSKTSIQLKGSESNAQHNNSNDPIYGED